MKDSWQMRDPVRRLVQQLSADVQSGTEAASLWQALHWRAHELESIVIAAMPVAALDARTVADALEDRERWDALVRRDDLPAAVQHLACARAWQCLGREGADAAWPLVQLAHYGRLGAGTVRRRLGSWAQMGEPRRARLRYALAHWQDLPADLYEVLTAQATFQQPLTAAEATATNAVPDVRPGLRHLAEHPAATEAHWTRWLAEAET